ncbi:fungal-specific transcription factor domain-containing protein [Lophiotrema nucula]|uniref:Fungal-specific transcription factor domain-containing protein n=1 Tax=Lophiotrema nucula TaxID=690887 RepID=A0A6A5Z1N2_9PLEO|nr:fungal-specific transcription factor domain-containing protein [Lophiotrema nucula]
MDTRPVADEPATRRRRPANACSTCRARKVRCDGRLGGCLNCERLELTCVPSSSTREVTPSSIVRQDNHNFSLAAGSKRKRSYRSCLSCRTSKIKCSGDKPCSRCRKRSATCEYDTDAEPAWVRSVAPSKSQMLDSTDAQSPEQAVLRLPHVNQDLSKAHIQDQHVPPALAWLEELELPPKPKLRLLFESYFDNIHPVRIFAFIHKPTFMRMLDEGALTSHADEALLHIMAALGARFYALEYHHSMSPLPKDSVQNAGRQWAKTAEQLLFAEYSSISTTRLKILILLHDFEARVGNYAQSFLLTGIITRMAHALQINNERSADVLGREESLTSNEVTLRETNRRLMWSCYMIDVWAGSGVDQLTLLRQADITIQLPCTDRHFMLQIPAVTEALQFGHHLEFLRSQDIEDNAFENLGMSAYYIRIISIWQQILRFVKHLDDAKSPWTEESEFASLNHQLDEWNDGLPSWLHFTPDNIYIRKESSQLGALFLLHCMYHHAICDLNRIALPELFRIQEPFPFPPEQSNFVVKLQAICFEEAQHVASLIATVLEHGARHLADPILPSYAYNSSRIMLYYIARVLDLSNPNAHATINHIIGLVTSNNQALLDMSLMYPLAEPLYITTERWLGRVRETLARGSPTTYIGPHDPSNLNEEEQVEDIEGPSPSSTIESVPDQQLNPLSMFRLTRKTLQNQNKMSASLPRRLHAESNTMRDNHLSQALPAGVLGDAPSNLPAQADTGNQFWAISNPSMPYSAGPTNSDLPLFDLDNFHNFFEWDFTEPMSGLGAFDSTESGGWMSGVSNM